MITQRQNPTAVIHVRFAGTSKDVPIAALDIGAGSTDSEIKRALSVRLGVDVARLEGCVVDRHANGNLTLRPQAVFG